MWLRPKAKKMKIIQGCASFFNVSNAIMYPTCFQATHFGPVLACDAREASVLSALLQKKDAFFNRRDYQNKR